MNYERIHFNEVTVLKSDGFRLKGREMSADFVNGDTGGESYAFFHLLLSIDFSNL